MTSEATVHFLTPYTDGSTYIFRVEWRLMEPYRTALQHTAHTSLGFARMRFACLIESLIERGTASGQIAAIAAYSLLIEILEMYAAREVPLEREGESILRGRVEELREGIEQEEGSLLDDIGVITLSLTTTQTDAAGALDQFREMGPPRWALVLWRQVTNVVELIT